jgi:hypothetical protein
MAFKSEAQRRYMHKNEPEIAKDWEQKTPNTPLPERVSKNPTPREKTIKRKSIMKYPRRR